jgi:hypothetical protein
MFIFNVSYVRQFPQLFSLAGTLPVILVISMIYKTSLHAKKRNSAGKYIMAHCCKKCVSAFVQCPCQNALQIKERYNPYWHSCINQKFRNLIFFWFVCWSVYSCSHKVRKSHRYLNYSVFQFKHLLEHLYVCVIGWLTGGCWKRKKNLRKSEGA